MGAMYAELSLYLELLGFLAGTLLYGFLLRAVLRRPDALPGNWPLRAALVALFVWFAATMVDHQVFLLLGVRDFHIAASLLDLARAGAWLLIFPLIAHTLERALALGWGFRRLAPVAWLAYLPILLLVPSMVAFGRAESTRLAAATHEVFGRVAAHAGLSLALGMVMAELLARRLAGRRFGTFLRALEVCLALILAAIVVSPWFAPWEPSATGFRRSMRTFLLLGPLLPGLLLAYFVRSSNLLRLSLSFRTVRHFALALAIVGATIAGGLVLGVEDLGDLRRFVAGGLFLGLILGTAYGAVADGLLDRSPALRKLLGRGIGPDELARLAERMDDESLDEDAARRQAATVLSDWLGTEAHFLPGREDDPEVAPIWDVLEGSEDALLTRIDPPNRATAALLSRLGLQAAFAIRIDGRLEAVLALPLNTAGGGYADDQLEAVRLLLGQLETSIALRRFATSRIAEERTQEGQERLSLLGMVSASLAHEIKNPLSAMKTLAGALREDLAANRLDPADGIGDLDVIIEQIDRLGATSREILGLARPRGDATTDLADLVRGTLYILSAEARRNAIEIDGQRVTEVGHLAGSVATWQTVVFNLVLNAIEHTAAGGTVTVALTHQGDAVLLEIANPSPPRTQAELEALFEPFVSTGGTGLGLPLVARRVRELGARASVRHDGERLIFTIATPVASSHPSTPEAAA